MTMAPPPSTTPTSRSSSVHMETNSDGSTIPSVVLNNGTKTSASAYSNPTPTSTANPNSTGHPNALPGYLPHPQIQHQQLQQQSLHNSSRYVRHSTVVCVPLAGLCFVVHELWFMCQKQLSR